MDGYTRIGDNCLVGDGTHSKIERHDSGVLYLTSRNFKDGSLDLSKVYYISEADYAKHFLSESKALARPQADDLVFSIIGTIGEPYLVRRTDNFGISSSVAIVRPKRDYIDPTFLLHWFKGPVFQSALFGIKGGVAQGYVSLEMIRSLPVPKFPLPVQHRIAGILSAYDELIENSQRRIRILEEMARTLYREWFVHFRFPGHEKVIHVASSLGDIPQGWEVKKLGDLISYNRRSTKPGPHLEERKYVPIDCLPSKSLALLEAKPIGEAQSSLQLFEKGDILFGAMRPYFHKVAVAPFAGVTRTTCFVFKPARPEWHAFATMTAFEEATVAYANAHSQGATIPYAVWDGSLSGMPLVLPPDMLLRRFENLVAPMLEQISQSFFVLNNLRQTRDLLLPRLLSGKVNLGEVGA